MSSAPPLQRQQKQHAKKRARQLPLSFGDGHASSSSPSPLIRLGPAAAKKRKTATTTAAATTAPLPTRIDLELESSRAAASHQRTEEKQAQQQQPPPPQQKKETNLELPADRQARYTEVDTRLLRLFKPTSKPTDVQWRFLAWVRRQAELSGKYFSSHERPITRGGGLLQAQQGLGKTLTALWQMASVLLETSLAPERGCACGCGKRAPKFLVVAPKDVVKVWLSDLAKHMRSASVLRMFEYAKRDDWRDPTEFDVCVCTYARLQIDLNDHIGKENADAALTVTPTTRAGREGYAKLSFLKGALDPRTGMVEKPYARRGLASMRWCYVFADEAHDTRNVAGKRSRALSCMLPTARLFWLTGTAVHKDGSDLLPLLLGVRDPETLSCEFASRLDVKSRVRHQWECTLTNDRLLQEDPHIVDRDPRMAYLDNPLVETEWAVPFEDPREREIHEAAIARLTRILKKIREYQSIDPDDYARRQQFTYEQLLEMDPDAGDDVEEARKGMSMQAFMFTQLLRARQSCISPALAVKSLAKHRDSPLCLQSTKLRLLERLLREKAGKREKLLVFSSFREALELAAEVVKRTGRQYRFFHGQQSKKQKEKSKDDFQDPEGDVTVLLCQLKVGGVGQTFTCATRVVFLDPWYNPQMERQAEARTYRIGQTRAVVVTYLLVAGSIEEWVRNVARGKLARADAIFDTEFARRSGVRLGSGGGGGSSGPTVAEIVQGLQFLKQGSFVERDTEEAAVERAKLASRARRLLRAAIPKKKLPVTPSSSARPQPPKLIDLVSGSEEGEETRDSGSGGDAEEDEPRRAFLCAWVMQTMLGGECLPRQCLVWSSTDPQEQSNFGLGGGAGSGWGSSSLGARVHYHWLHALLTLLSNRTYDISSQTSAIEYRVATAQHLARAAREASVPTSQPPETFSAALADTVARRLMPPPPPRGISRWNVSLPQIRVELNEADVKVSGGNAVVSGQLPSAERVLRLAPAPTARVQQHTTCLTLRLDPECLLLDAYLRAARFVFPRESDTDGLSLTAWLPDPQEEMRIAHEDEKRFLERALVPIPQDGGSDSASHDYDHLTKAIREQEMRRERMRMAILGGGSSEEAAIRLRDLSSETRYQRFTQRVLFSSELCASRDVALAAPACLAYLRHVQGAEMLAYTAGVPGSPPLASLFATCHLALAPEWHREASSERAGVLVLVVDGPRSLEEVETKRTSTAHSLLQEKLEAWLQTMLLERFPEVRRALLAARGEHADTFAASFASMPPGLVACDPCRVTRRVWGLEKPAADGAGAATSSERGREVKRQALGVSTTSACPDSLSNMCPCVWRETFSRLTSWKLHAFKICRPKAEAEGAEEEEAMEIAESLMAEPM